MTRLLHLCRAVILAGLLVGLAGQALAAGRRVALVVGNSAYAHADRLANPANDARLIAQALRQAGFSLVGDGAQLDLTKQAFDSVVRRFGSAVEGADVALFYYAGHGMQVDGTNWLVPVDAALSRPQDLEFVMLDAGAVLRQMEGAGTKLNLVMLDACRDNPFLAGLGRMRGNAPVGLAQIRAPEGTLISYATQPGAAAADGTGADSPYSLALAEALRQPGLELFQVFNQVGVRVKANTGGRQVPWMSNSPIEGSFYFVPPQTAATVPSGPDAEVAFWQSIAGSADPADFQDYLQQYPQGSFAPLARRKFSSLQKPAVLPPPPPPPPPPPETSIQENLTRGDAALVGKDNAGAMRWYRKAAEQGNAAAQFNVGALYHNGQGVPPDYREAMRWYLKAADQGNSDALFNIGVLYDNGLGVPKDYKEAMRWYRKAADLGHKFAQTNIGVLFDNGSGVVQDHREALRWYRKAADQGFSYAQFNIGVAYENGDGVARDIAEARRWYRLAAAQGDTNAKYRLTVIGE